MDEGPKCINNSHAVLICMNDTCNQPNPFVCGITNHECKQYHRTCVKLQWMIFKEKLNENRQIIELLCNKVEKVIIKGIQQFKELLDNFKNWKKQYGVDRIEEFYKCIQLNKETKWTGNDICKLRNDKQIKFDNMNIDTNKIETILVEIELNKLEFMKIIKRFEEQLKLQVSSNILKIKSFELSELIKKLEQINQQPEHMELKFCINK